MAALVVAPRRIVMTQATVWPWVDDRALAGPAAARHYVGAFYEEATRILTGATPHQTTSAADVCPDLSHAGGAFLECKALASGSAYVFERRFAKDARLARQTGRPVCYVYWIHTAPTRTARSLYHLREILAAHTTHVLAIPATRLRRLARSQPGISLEYRQGLPPEPGWRLARGDLFELAGVRSAAVQMPSVHGCPMPPIQVHGDLAALFGRLPESAQSTAAELLAELSEHCLTVELAPAPAPRFAGQMVRQVVAVNPPWYRRLAASWGAKSRRTLRWRRRNSADPDIRRPRIERALERLSQGCVRTVTDIRLLPLIHSWNRTHA